MKKALHNIWEVFSEFYSWIDPEELEGDEDEDDDWTKTKTIDRLAIEGRSLEVESEPVIRERIRRSLKAREMSKSGETDAFPTLHWVGDAATGYLKMVDQTLLPTEHVEIECRDVPTVWEAIKSLRVRGAPAIGVAAAYGAVIGARSQGCEDGATVRRALEEATASLRTSRPTAVNLFWALDRMDRCLASDDRDDGRALLEKLLAEARTIDERRSIDVPRDRATRRSSGPAGSRRAHALQRRRPGNRRLRNRTRGDLRCA